MKQALRSGLKLHAKLSPQQQLSIRLIQLPAHALLQEINQAMNNNPFLERLDTYQSEQDQYDDLNHSGNDELDFESDTGKPYTDDSTHIDHAWHTAPTARSNEQNADDYRRMHLRF